MSDRDAKIPDDLDIERLLDDVLDASYVVEQTEGDRSDVRRTFDAARQALLDAVGRVRWRPSSSTAPRAGPATIPVCVVTAPRVAQERMGDVAEAAAMGWKLTGNVVEPPPAPAPRQPSAAEEERACGGPKESCPPCRAAHEHETHRCPECGVWWCEECEPAADTNGGTDR